MPSCVVKSCKNNTKVNKKSEGITFHIFPTEGAKKHEWVAAIRTSRNEPQWQPSTFSVVCSDHFHDSDLYITGRGLRRVIKNGYPQKKLFSSNVVVDDTVLFPSSNLVAGNTTLPSTSPASILDLPGSPSVAVDNTVLFPASNVVAGNTTLRSTSPVSILDLPGSPSGDVDNTILVTSANVVAGNTALQSTSPLSILGVSTMSSMIDDKEKIIDKTRKQKLRKILKIQEQREKGYKKKIKTLQQMVRRLTNRNKSLKDNILKHLKKQNYLENAHGKDEAIAT